MKIFAVLALLAALICGPVSHAIADQDPTDLSGSLKGKLIRLTLDSHMLRRTTAVYVYLPPGYDGSRERYPVIYLLHGNPGKSSDLFSKGHMQETAEKLIIDHKIHPMIMVAADCFGSGGSHTRNEFLNSSDGKMRAEDFVAHELPDFIDSHYRTIRSADARALGGLSSGGYGAINIGGKHSDEFHILFSHSGFFDPKDEDKYVTHMLGPEGPLWDVNNPIKQVRNWHDKKSLHVYMDIGDDDEALQQNRDLAGELEKYGVDHVFKVEKGKHAWSLWRGQFGVALVYVDKWLH